MSPTKRTRSVANTGRLSSAGIIGNPWNGASPRSLPSAAAVDRDDARHAPRRRSTSIDVIVPWATGERTNTTWAMPGSVRSSTYFPAPVSSVGSSSRCTALPRIEPDVAMEIPSLKPAKP